MPLAVTPVALTRLRQPKDAPGAKRAPAEASALRLSCQRASVPLSYMEWPAVVWEEQQSARRIVQMLARVLPPIPIRNPDTTPPPSTPTPTPTTPIPATPIPAACLCGRASGSIDRGGQGRHA